MGEEGKAGDVGEEKRRPISEAEFLAWKSRREADISARRDEAARKRAQDIAAGTTNMNGRELFVHEPWVFDNNLY